MSAITDLPKELFFNKIFSYLPATDILSLGCTNQFFATIVTDEPFWHKRIWEDYNFTGSDSARQVGWKLLYRRFSNPPLYVWGFRLGLKEFPKTSVLGCVPFPIRLDIPGVRIVTLATGRFAFHALDSHGNIYVWGSLEGLDGPSPDNGFANPSQEADHPVRLQLPVKFRSLSCGGFHTTALDAAAQVWTFTSWGRPFRLSASSIDKSSLETTPVQVESGWSFSSILTESGDVLVYWLKLGGRVQEVIDHKMEELDSSDDVELKAASMARPSEDEPDVVPCYWWVLQGAELIRLPTIPTGRLPKLECTGLEDDPEETIRLVKIAGFDNNILGLTNKGHVLRYGNLSGEDTYQTGCWEYLPFFSDIKQIRTLPAYTRHGENEGPSVTPPETLWITHISASFDTFFAYSTDSSSTVLMGRHILAQRQVSRNQDPLTNVFKPTVIPELQHRSVISVVVGDYHYGALTSDGKLLTWGKVSKGALGLGDPVDIELGQPGGFATEEAWLRAAMNGDWRLMSPPPDVVKPTEVRFDYEDKRKRRKYCFAAVAHGWHTGALVVDLDPDEEGDGAVLE